MRREIICILILLGISLAYADDYIQLDGTQENLTINGTLIVEYTFYNSTTGSYEWKNLTITMPQYYINGSVSCGMNFFDDVGNCHVNVTSSYPASRCSITRDLNAGESFDFENSNCDIHFTCSPDQQKCEHQDVDLHIRLTRQEDGDIKIETPNATYYFYNNSNDMDLQFLYSCDYLVNPPSYEEKVQATIEQCREYLDEFNTQFGSAIMAQELSRCLEQKDDLATEVARFKSQWEECSSDLNACKNQSSLDFSFMKSNLTVCQQQVYSLSSDLSKKEHQLDICKRSKDLIIVSFVMIISFAVVGFYLTKNFMERRL